jgi:glycosyltransferase involved in cell wall biosynthesis
MLEPLGQSQVLAYLEKLAADRRIHLISYEKRSDWADRERRDAIAARIAAAGIGWHPLRYHKSPSALATAYDVAVGTAKAIALVARHRLSIVHARSYVPALIALGVKRVTGARFLFDIRGLWADERVDGGLWPAGGRLYRAAKSLERRFFKAADHVVTLTHASAAAIRGFPYLARKSPPITVIPTCADLDRFKSAAGPNEHPVTLGFVGAANTWSLFDEVLSLYRALLAREPQARLLVVNRGEHDWIRSRIARSGTADSAVELVSADHGAVPALITRMTFGAAVRKPTYSQIACAPTKLAEYLGCGVPAIINRGVGDAADIVERERVGVVLTGFSPEEINRGVDELLALARDPDLADRCRRTAVKLFSLDSGVEAYGAIYETLAQAGPR